MKQELSAEEIEHRKELARIRNRNYRARHPEKMKAQREARSDHMKELQKAWYERKKDGILEKRKRHYAANREASLAYQTEYQKKNRKKVNKRKREWMAKKKATDAEYAKRRSNVCTSYIRKRKEADSSFRLMLNVRARLRRLIGNVGAVRSAVSMALTGCDLAALRKHIESQFEPWMNWKNYGFGPGKWVVDHIRPCAGFDLSDEKQQRECFHFSNLRPLCWRKNIEKSDS